MSASSRDGDVTGNTNHEVDSTSYTLPDGRTVIGRDAYEAELVKGVFAPVTETFSSEIVEDPSVPTPCIVTLPSGGYDVDHDVSTGQRELYIHAPADARSVGEALLAVAEIHEEPGQAAGVDLSFGAVLPPELDSKVSSGDQDGDADFIESVLDRHRAAAETLTEREWAALGRRLLRDQLEPGGQGVPISATEHLADLSGVSVRRLWLGEES